MNIFPYTGEFSVYQILSRSSKWEQNQNLNFVKQEQICAVAGENSSSVFSGS